jgi:hypothetical protein
MKNRTRILLVLIVFLLSALCLSDYSQAAQPVDVAIGWQNSFLAQGRDGLEEGGLVAGKAVTELGAFELAAWYGRGDRTDFEELDLALAWGMSLGTVDAGFSWTRIEALSARAFDNELGVELALSQFPGLQPGLAWIYSLEAGGGFLEFTLSAEHQLARERLTLATYVTQGMDYGYASPAYDGPNHLQLGLDADYRLNDRLHLVSSLAKSWAQSDLEREGCCEDVFLMSLGLTASF